MDKYNKYGWIPISYKEAIDKISTNNKKIKQKKYISNGKYPVIDQGQDFIGGFTNDESKLLNCTLPALVFGDHTKIVKLVNYEFAPGADGVKVVVPRKFFNAKLFEFFTKILALKIPDKGYARHFQYIEKSKIPLPPLPEQRAIVSKIEQLFSDLDNGIENFKKAQEQLKHYRQSVLKNACEGKLVPTEAELACAEGRDYEPANVLLARILKERREKWNGRGKYKEPAAPNTNGLSLLPEGWCWVRLDSLAALKGGITKDQNRKVADARKIPYLRVANVQRGYLDLSEIKKIEAKESVISELLLKPGDILFNEGGDRDKLGRGCIWNGELEECIYQNHIFRARIYSSDSSNKIISWFGNTFGQRYFMKEGKQTTNLASINLTKLSAFPVPLSPLTEQCRIVSEVERRLSLCDKMEATIAESLKKAESLRQSILKKAFEGKLLNEKELEEARNAPDWEPAEKLVERIRQEKQIKENNNKPTRRKTHG